MPLSDRRLAQLARTWKQHQAVIKDEGTVSVGLRARIIEELERRGLKKLESVDGVTITRVQSEIPNIDDVALMDEMTPRQLKAVTTMVLDHGKLGRAVQEGIVDQELIAKHTTIRLGSPYINVTIKDAL